MPNKFLENTETSILPLIQFEGADKNHEWPVRLLLAFLHGLSRIYGGIVQLRLFLFERGIIRRSMLGVQVISVGNISVGGTGKTPMVEALARELSKKGRKVAILSRGYRRKEKSGGEKFRDVLKFHPDPPPSVVSDGKRLLLDSEYGGDEPYMLANNLDGVAVIVDKDRVKSGRYAIRKFGCDTLILDDGFQYQKLKHRFDLVLVDCGNPFGNGNVLPRGTLREPAGNIRRAKFICLTKAEGRDNSALKEKLRKLNPTAGLMECDHMPKLLRNAFTREEKPLEFLKGLKITAISGIASPVSFETSLEKLGAEIKNRVRFADHHRFSQQDVINLVNDAAELGVDAIITTEKDAVRMPRIDRCAIPVYYLRIEVRFNSGLEEFERCVNEITFTASGKHSKRRKK